MYVHGKPRDSRCWLSDPRGGQRGSRPNAGGAAEGCHAYEHEGVAAPGGTLSPHSSRGRATYVACRPFTLCARMVLRGGHAGSSLRFMETDSIPCPEGRLLQRRVVSRPSRAVSVLARRQDDSSLGWQRDWRIGHDCWACDPGEQVVVLIRPALRSGDYEGPPSYPRVHGGHAEEQVDSTSLGLRLSTHAWLFCRVVGFSDAHSIRWTRKP